MSVARIPKHPDESFSISVNFANLLVQGETVSSAVVTRLSGTATVGTAAVQTPLVSFNVSAGTSGGVTAVEVKATTSLSEILVGLVDVPIDDRSF